MVKKILLSLGLTSLLVSGLMACEAEGCTPGFWKNHAAAWEVYTPGQSYSDLFGVDADAMESDVNVAKAYNKLGFTDVAGDLQLGEALWLKGNDDKLKQLVRTSAAALLNISAGLDLVVPGYSPKPMTETALKVLVQHAFAGTGGIDAGALQSALDYANNEGCPF